MLAHQLVAPAGMRELQCNTGALSFIQMNPPAQVRTHLGGRKAQLQLQRALLARAQRRLQLARKPRAGAIARSREGSRVCRVCRVCRGALRVRAAAAAACYVRGPARARALGRVCAGVPGMVLRILPVARRTRRGRRAEARSAGTEVWVWARAWSPGGAAQRPLRAVGAGGALARRRPAPQPG